MDDKQSDIANEALALQRVTKYINAVDHSTSGLVHHYFSFIDLMSYLEMLSLSCITKADIAYKLVYCFENRCKSYDDCNFIEAVSNYLKCLDPDILPDIDYCTIHIDIDQDIKLVHEEALCILTKYIVDIRTVIDTSPDNTAIMNLVIRLFIYIKRILSSTYGFTEKQKAGYIKLICDTFEQQRACTHILVIHDLLHIAIMDDEL